MIGDYNQEQYISKINQVQDYIESHISEPLSLEQLAGMVHFSPFYFHRLFRFVTDESLYQYIQRIRLEKSIFLLQSDPNKSITDIGLDVGFSNQASFAKAFKKAYGVSASAFRKISGDSLTDKVDFESITASGESILFQNRVKNMLRDYEQRLSQIVLPQDVRIQTIPAKELVYIRYAGAYKGDKDLFMNLFTRLYQWANERNLIKSISNWVVIYHDQSDLTEDDKLRLSVCLEVDKSIETSGEIGAYHLASGNYALGRFEVDETEYQSAWDYMLFRWIPKSGYKVSDRLAFEAYASNHQAEGQNKIVVEICIPIESIN